MRVTNNMINKNNMVNMNNNKASVDFFNKQMTTQKKISRPSEDPVIAIRALRLRSNLNEINQYYEKNIPDAESWLELTETALDNMKTILTDVYAQCVNGSTGTLTADDRSAILQNLQSLRTQVYKEGDADNAGRTIFTGYKTDSKLTFDKDEQNTSYSLTEKLSYESIGEKKYHSNTVSIPTNSTEVNQGVAEGDLPKEETNNRIRLSYGDINEATGVTMTQTDADGNQVPLEYTDPNGVKQTVNVTTISYDDWAKEPNQFTVPDNEAFFIPETGEIIMGKDIAEGLKGDKAEFSVSYTKTGFKEGEIRPEHYFDCQNTTDPRNVITYKKESQDISYTISFNQDLIINTQASDVFNAAIGRDVDELTDAVTTAIAARDKVDKIKAMMKQTQYADPASQEKLNQWLEAANKEATFMDENMKGLYSKSIGTFQGYLSDVTAAVTDVGSKGDRLKLTKGRVENQQAVFKQLKSGNEDRELSDIIVDFTSAQTAYQASLLASSKASQQTLLNYI